MATLNAPNIGPDPQAFMPSLLLPLHIANRHLQPLSFLSRDHMRVVFKEGPPSTSKLQSWRCCKDLPASPLVIVFQQSVYHYLSLASISALSILFISLSSARQSTLAVFFTLAASHLTTEPTSRIFHIHSSLFLRAAIPIANTIAISCFIPLRALISNATLPGSGYMC